MNSPERIVFDCMIYLQAMISPTGAASACLDSVKAAELHLLWSDYILQEIRELPEKVSPRLKLTPERVEIFIASVAPYIEHVGSIPAIYVNPFDPDDSHYINLAAAAQADLITTRDGDLLQLMDDSRAEACEFRKLFPRLKILQPDQVLDLLRQKRAD